MATSLLPGNILLTLPERGFGEPVITQHPILIITQGEQGFRRVRLQFLRILQSTFRCVAPSGGSSVVAVKVDDSASARESRAQASAKLGSSCTARS